MASVTLIPNSYTNTGSYNFTTSTNTSRQMSNAYNNADNTSSSARLQLASNRSSTRTSTMYLEFDKSALENIPSNATIGTITANVRYYVNNTTYVSAVSIQLHSNTTAKGSAVTNRPTSSTKYSITPGTWTRSELNNIRLYISATHNASTSTGYLYLYGADVTINYTASTVHVTGVSVSPATASVEAGDTTALTATVTPSNASDTSVSWSSSNTSIATVDSSGIVTGVGAGSATITATTTDGGYTASSIVTVTQPVMEEYTVATSFEVGKQYLIANGNTGTVYVMTSESGGASILKGVQATITNGILSISQANATKSLFTVELDDASDTETIWLKHGTSYIYSDSSNGLRMDTARTPRYWHYRSGQHILWFYNGTNDDYGYNDTSGTYKYYLEVSNGNFTDGYVTSPSIADSTLPEIYIFVKYEGTSMPLRVKQSGTWATAQKVFVKQNGSWVQASKVLVKDNGTWK